MALETLAHCPLCNNSSFVHYLECKDYTSTQENFKIQECTDCHLRFTNPRPDHDSLSKYYNSPKYISHTGKSAGLIDYIYLIVRKFTLRWKTNFINQFKQKGTILDYGCGTGELLQKYQSSGWKIDGVEPSPLARQKASNLTGINIASDLAELKPGSYDIITLWHVLEHIPDMLQKMQQLRHLLKKDGILLIAVPNHESYDSLHYQQFWAAYDVPRHLSHFSKETMKATLTTSGFQLRSIHPMLLDSYYVSLLSQKYRFPDHSSISNFLDAIITGWKSNHKANKQTNHSSLIYIAHP